MPTPTRKPVSELGLDRRHRDQAPPKSGRIQQKRGDTLNKNLSQPIQGFSPLAKLQTMRDRTGQAGIEAIRQVAKRRRN